MIVKTGCETDGSFAALVWRGGWRPGAGCPLCWLQTLETPSTHEAGGEPGPGHQGGLPHHHLYSTVQYSTVQYSGEPGPGHQGGLPHHHLAGAEAGGGEDVATSALTRGSSNLKNLRHGV